MSEYPVEARGERNRLSWFRLLGPLLLVALLLRLDFRSVYATLLGVDLGWALLAVLLFIPLIALKTVRWQALLRNQSVPIHFLPAFLAYFASLFIGFLTPGRLGEFTKALYIWRDFGLPFGRALSSVLADRLFDLYFLFLASVLALIGLFTARVEWVVTLAVALLLVVPLALFLDNCVYAWVQHVGARMGRLGVRTFGEQGWLTELRLGLRQLRWPVVCFASLLTTVAYGVFFTQCYLLAVALGMPVSFWQTAGAVAVGGMVTLVPVSISGLGTREAVITAYLGHLGVPYETALSFSLLVLVATYLVGGLLGAAALWFMPLPRTTRSHAGSGHEGA